MLLSAALLLPQLISSPPPDAVRLATPGVEYRTNIASASRKPWVTANGWRLDRDPAKTFYYEAAGHAAAIAAAEAFAHGCRAYIHTDKQGAADFNTMLTFLRTLEPGPTTPLVDFGIVDDGSAATGEFMNRLALQNFLFAPRDSRSALQIDPRNSTLEDIRQKAPDKRRLIRLFGSDVVLAHLSGDAAGTRLHLINYSGHPVRALRVRVLGSYPGTKGSVDLQDFDITPEATEFSVSEMKDYAVINLLR